jgi:hypothetical protein
VITFAIKSVVFACGAAGLLALTACSSGGSGSSASPVSTPATGSPGSPSAAGQPSWAAALGPGVTVVPPQHLAPGYSSPGAVVSGYVADIDAKHYAESCDYAEPDLQAHCRTGEDQTPASDQESQTGFALGYVAIDGNRAVAGMTGRFCTGTKCFTNNDPAAVFSTAKSFSALWDNAASQTTGYSLTPLTETGGKWYVGVGEANTLN